MRRKKNYCVVEEGTAYCSAVHWKGSEEVDMAKNCEFYRNPIGNGRANCAYQGRGWNCRCRNTTAAQQR